VDKIIGDRKAEELAIEEKITYPSGQIPCRPDVCGTEFTVSQKGILPGKYPAGYQTFFFDETTRICSYFWRNTE
jgi:hypothetical protein